MDESNPVVKLCVQGINAESEGRHDDARGLFLQAWDVRQSSLDACIAAHYVARHQEHGEDELHWNQLALEYAREVDDPTILGFYPSLYLNLGWSNETLGNLEEAREFYRLAAESVDGLPDGPYRDQVQHGIARALERVGNWSS